MIASLLVFGLLGGWLLAGRRAGPLTRITDARRGWLRTDRSRTESSWKDVRGEFRGLADAFDTMLARLEAHITEQQRFAAKGCHRYRALRSRSRRHFSTSPANDPSRDTSELVDQFSTPVDSQAINLTEALLLLSRADQRSITARTRRPIHRSGRSDRDAPPTGREKLRLTIETSGDVGPHRALAARFLLQLTTNLVQTQSG